MRAITDRAAASSEPTDPFHDVLDRALGVLRDAGIPFLVIGEIGSAVWGRDRGTTDVDLFVRPEAAPRVLELLADDGFRTRVEYEHWLSKATLHGIDVDVIFRASRDILLDEEMLARARRVRYRGRTLPVAPPEDLIVMKACAAREDTARYWYDAVAILSRADLDWSYLVERARRHGPRRVLSLLLFAGSVDVAVPSGPVDDLFAIVGGGGDGADG